MITITETLYKKMPDDIKACFNQLPNPSAEEVRECFPETTVGARKAGQLRHTKEGDLNFTGNTYTLNDYPANSGNASRFFKSIIYTAKASKSERNKGCEELEEKEATKFDGGDFQRGKGNNAKEQTHKNNHPTVKPIALMEYLIKMVTKPGGIVLDPFAGSGSTLIAAKKNGFQYIGIEKEKDYCEISKSRLLAIQPSLL